MQSLFNYLYTSNLSPNAPTSCVADIVRISKINNKQRGITGLLIFDGEQFCQYLEGEEIKVRDLVETIKRDQRHIAFTTLHEGCTDQPRRFESWSIAYAVMDQASLQTFFGSSPKNGLAMQTLENLLPSLDLQPA